MRSAAVVLALLAVVCCLSPATALRGSSPSRTPRPSTPSPTPTRIPAALQPYQPLHLPSAIVPGQLNYMNFSRPEGVRELWLYVPSNYTASVAWPLAIYFHGYGSGPVLQNGYHQGIYLNVRPPYPPPPSPIPS